MTPSPPRQSQAGHADRRRSPTGIDRIVLEHPLGDEPAADPAYAPTGRKQALRPGCQPPASGFQ